MPISEEIYTAADGQGIGLAEYLSKNYTKKQLAELEANVITQLDSLKSGISDFMKGIEVTPTSPELASASREKLDVMQTRVRERMRVKSIELDEMIGSPAFDIYASTPVAAEGFEEGGSCFGAMCAPQQTDLLLVE